MRSRRLDEADPPADVEPADLASPDTVEADPPADVEPADLASPDTVEADPGAARVGRRAAGPRAQRMQQRRRRARWRRRGLAMGGVGLLGALVVVGLVLGSTIVEERQAPVAQETPAPGPDQRTLLLVYAPDEGGPAVSVTLFAAGPGDTQALATFVPVGTLVDIPGFGLDRLALAHQYGGAVLVEAAVENALGIAVDEVATVSGSALAAFLGGGGGYEIAVPERLVERAEDGSATERFLAGEQFLDGQRLTEYWSFGAPGVTVGGTSSDDELAIFPRHELVLEGLLDQLGDADVRADVLGDGAPSLTTTAAPEWLAELFAEMAEARADDRLTFTLLPVQPFGGPGPDGAATYRVDDDGAADLVAGALADSVPDGGGSAALRVQILNGVGTPGIGEAVDTALDDSGLRIVRTDNASSFDFEETLILVYAEDETSLSTARRVRDLLGVGTIQVSRQPQTVVDLTIVVGADFDASDSGAAN